MVNESVDKNAETTEVVDLLQELKDYALTVGEDCPEGHRRDPASGACLPMGPIDYTAETRSKNVDYGPEWRGEVDKGDTTPMINVASQSEVGLDADEMDEPESCAAGTTFSFIQRQCISLEDAEAENADEYAIAEDGTPLFEDEEDARNGHEEVIRNQPEGRRDTVNHDCPPDQFFDYKLRECIPLNKDTVMASEDFSDEFKQAVATYARLAMSSPDPEDGHKHVATLDKEGNGVTSSAGYGDSSHHHEVKKFVVQDCKCADGTTSMHLGFAIPEEHRVESLDYGQDDVEAVPAPSVGTESAAPLKGGQRKALPDSSFGVPGKRKFPLDTCGRVRNAMARFDQGKGLTTGEKATLRRKILARAKSCGIEVQNFGKANTAEEFAAVAQELIAMETKNDTKRLEAYRAEAQGQGPCPPGMNWDAANTRCTKVRGFVEELANHSDIVKHQPEGRRDPVGFQCPPGEFFDFTNRRCLPLDPSRKPGTTTTKANEEEEGAQRDLVPSPEGLPAKLSIDCPEGTIWDKKKEDCVPLDSRKKTKSEEEEAKMPDFIKKMMDKKKDKDGKDGDDKKKGKKGKKGFVPFTKKSKSEEEEEEDATSCGDGAKKKKKPVKKAMSEEDEDAQTTPNGPGKKGGPGCPEGQFMNPVTKKCMPRKGAFKGKSEQEEAENAQPGNREGLTPAPAGKVQHPTDCPPNTAWDAKNKICRPIDSMDKNRPSGPSPQPPTSVAEVEEMSTAALIKELDAIIKEMEAPEKNKVAARELPNAAFPPSLVSSSQRNLMHHVPDVEDPYDTATVDVARLRNSLFRATTVQGFSEKAVEDAIEHLLFHAREIVDAELEKKS